jgi:hypothetical protein
MGHRYSYLETMIYKSGDGRVYPLHVPPQRVVMQEEGFGMPPIEYVTDRAPFQHGDSLRSFYLAPRTIQLVILHNFCSRAEYWVGRNNLLNVLRPIMHPEPPPPGQLLYHMAGGLQRALDVYIESGPGYTPQEGWREWSFTEALRFVAHDPTWYDPRMRSQVLLPTNPTTDLVFPITFPIVFSETAGSKSYIMYPGTFATYPTVSITGPIIGFELENTTVGAKLGLIENVPEGYTVTFVLHGLKTVTGSDGQNWLNRVSADSDLTTFALWPNPSAPDSVNEFHIGGTGTNAQTRVVVSYYERYIGI